MNLKHKSTNKAGYLQNKKAYIFNKTKKFGLGLLV